MAVRQPFVVQPELMEKGRVQIVHVNLALHRGEPELVGRPMRDSWAETATGQPHGEPARIMISTRPVVLRVRGAAELAAPPYDRVVEQPAGLQVGEQQIPAIGLSTALAWVACFGRFECWSQAGSPCCHRN